MVEHSTDRFEVHLDRLRELARDCRSSGEDILSSLAEAEPEPTRMAASGGVAEQFWEISEHARRRHLDMMRTAADALAAGARDLDALADLLSQTDDESSHAITSSYADRPTGG